MVVAEQRDPLRLLRGSELPLKLLPGFLKHLRGGCGLVLLAQKGCEVNDPERGDRRFLKRVGVELSQRVDGVVLISLQHKHFRTFQVRRPDESRVRELSREPLERGAGFVQRVVPLVARLKLNREPLLAVPELQNRVGRLVALRVGRDERVEQPGGSSELLAKHVILKRILGLRRSGPNVAICKDIRHRGEVAGALRGRDRLQHLDRLLPVFGRDGAERLPVLAPADAIEFGVFRSDFGVLRGGIGERLLRVGGFVLLHERFGLRVSVFRPAEEDERHQRAVRELLLEGRDASVGSRKVAGEVVRGDEPLKRLFGLRREQLFVPDGLVGVRSVFRELRGELRVGEFEEDLRPAGFRLRVLARHLVRLVRAGAERVDRGVEGLRSQVGVVRIDLNRQPGLALAHPEERLVRESRVIRQRLQRLHRGIELLRLHLAEA